MELGTERKYSNFVKLNLSLFDFSFDFYDRKDMSLELKTEELIAEMVFSPQLAKTLMLVLQTNIKNYEDIFGAINLEANTEALKRIQNQK